MEGLHKGKRLTLVKRRRSDVFKINDDDEFLFPAEILSGTPERKKRQGGRKFKKCTL